MTRPAQTEAGTVSYQPVLNVLISIGYQVSVRRSFFRCSRCSRLTRSCFLERPSFEGRLLFLWSLRCDADHMVAIVRIGLGKYFDGRNNSLRTRRTEVVRYRSSGAREFSNSGKDSSSSR